MIFTDGIHLISKDLDELHSFAKKVGLKRCWFHAKSYPHYDLNKKITSNKVVKSGAKLISKRELIRILRKEKRRIDMKTVKILLLIFLFVSVSNAQTGFPIHIVLQVGDTLSIEWEYDWIGSDSLKEYIVNFNLWINQGEDTTFVGETEKDSVTFRPPLNGKIDIRYISGRYAVGMSAVDYWGRESLIHFSTDTTAAYGGWSVINDPFGPGKPHSSNLVK